MPAFTGPLFSGRCSPLNVFEFGFRIGQIDEAMQTGSPFRLIRQGLRPLPGCAKFLPAISEATEFIKPAMGYKARWLLTIAPQ
jgi:hypothetical protein